MIYMVSLGAAPAKPAANMAITTQLSANETVVKLADPGVIGTFSVLRFGVLVRRS